MSGRAGGPGFHSVSSGLLILGAGHCVIGYRRGEGGLYFRRLVIGKKGEGEQLLGLRSGMQLTRGLSQAHGFSGSVARP